MVALSQRLQVNRHPNSRHVLVRMWLGDTLVHDAARRGRKSDVSANDLLSGWKWTVVGEGLRDCQATIEPAPDLLEHCLSLHGAQLS
jgi:hypothetical protein